MFKYRLFEATNPGLTERRAGSASPPPDTDHESSIEGEREGKLATWLARQLGVLVVQSVCSCAVARAPVALVFGRSKLVPHFCSTGS